MRKTYGLPSFPHDSARVAFDPQARGGKGVAGVGRVPPVPGAWLKFQGVTHSNAQRSFASTAVVAGSADDLALSGFGEGSGGGDVGALGEGGKVVELHFREWAGLVAVCAGLRFKGDNTRALAPAEA